MLRPTEQAQRCHGSRAGARATIDSSLAPGCKRCHKPGCESREGRTSILHRNVTPAPPVIRQPLASKMPTMDQKSVTDFPSERFQKDVTGRGWNPTARCATLRKQDSQKMSRNRAAQMAIRIWRFPKRCHGHGQDLESGGPGLYSGYGSRCHGFDLSRLQISV